MKNLIISLLAALGITTACTAQSPIKTVAPAEFASLIKADAKAVIVDVRTAQEYADGHLAGATLINFLQESTFKQAIARLDKTNTYYVYCRSGRRSHAAAEQMQRLGLRVVDMQGGFMAWRQARMPIAVDPLSKDIAEETFTTASGQMVRIGLIKHGSLYISYDNYHIEVDPVAAYGKPTRYDALPKADVILVTHEHGDHLDATAIAQLTKQTTQLYLNARSHEKIGQGKVVANGDHFAVGHGIEVTAVPAYNTTPAHLQFHPKGVGNGYVVTIDGLRIYVAGDTEDIDEMSQLTDIDVAFLPVNQPYTMTVEQAVRAARVIHPRVLIPYHFGQTEVARIKQLLADTDIDVRLRDMQ